MTKLVLTFNEPAAKALGANTRLRVKPLKRGGVEYVALRPSYRVSGKNEMIRVIKGEDGVLTAEMDHDKAIELKLPEIKASNTNYIFEDVGYGWFILKDVADTDLEKASLVTISKSRKAMTKTDDAAPAAEAEVEVDTKAGKADDADATE